MNQSAESNVAEKHSVRFSHRLLTDALLTLLSGFVEIFLFLRYGLDLLTLSHHDPAEGMAR